MKILFIGSRLFDDIAFYLKEKNIYSIVTESNENADNLDLADEFYIVSRGMDEPLKIAIANNVDAIIPLIGVDSPLIEIGYLKDKAEKEFSIPVIASDARAAKITSNKINTKYFFDKINVNTPEYKIIDKENYKNENFTFPCVLKQAEGQAGTNILIAKSLVDVDNYFEKFDIALCEEFIIGSEISVEVIGFNGDYVALTPIYKGETTLDGTHPLSKIKKGPCEIDGLSNEYIKEIALKIAQNLRSDGIFEMDFMFSINNKKLYAIEINARPNGTRYMTTATCGISSLLQLVDMASNEFSSNKIKENLNDFVSIEIPIGNFNGPEPAEPLKSFKYNDYIVHAPEGYQRVTISASSKDKLQNIIKNLNLESFL